MDASVYRPTQTAEGLMKMAAFSWKRPRIYAGNEWDSLLSNRSAHLIKLLG